MYGSTTTAENRGDLPDVQTREESLKYGQPRVVLDLFQKRRDHHHFCD